MSDSIDFTDLGPGTVRRVTKKAALVELDDHDGEHAWIPFSLMATPTAAKMIEGEVLRRVRVETWFAEKMELA